MSNALGFLMLQTRFPRIVGDGGCPRTWDFPTRYHIVDGSTPTRVVQQRAADLLPAFIDGGMKLVQQGVVGVSTTCGFLCLHQRALSDALPVPVLTSALLLAPRIIATLPPDKTLGILTASAADLSPDHLHAANIPPQRVTIGGLPPQCDFARTLLENRDTLNEEQAQQDMTTAAQTLQASDANIAALLFECTNMPPYADAVQAATGLPVYSIIDAVNTFYRDICETRKG